MIVCMYAHKYTIQDLNICMYVCMYAYMYVRTYVCIDDILIYTDSNLIEI